MHLDRISGKRSDHDLVKVGGVISIDHVMHVQWKPETSNAFFKNNWYTKLFSFGYNSSLQLIYCNCVCVIIIRVSFLNPLFYRFEQRGDMSVIRSYGGLLAEMSACVPDGIVCFFVRWTLFALTVYLRIYNLPFHLVIRIWRPWCLAG